MGFPALSVCISHPGDEAREPHGLCAGARGFPRKEGPADEVIAAVRAVARGELVIDPRLASPALDRADRHQQPL